MTSTRTAAVFGALALIVLTTPSCFYGPRPEPQRERPRPNYPPYPNPGNPDGFRDDGLYGPGDQPSPDDRLINPPPPADDIPVARRTDNPNRVISPHPPYNVVDVTGFQSGELARDPTIEGKKIFRVP